MLDKLLALFTFKVIYPAAVHTFHMEMVFTVAGRSNILKKIPRIVRSEARKLSALRHCGNYAVNGTVPRNFLASRAYIFNHLFG